MWKLILIKAKYFQKESKIKTEKSAEHLYLKKVINHLNRKNYDIISIQKKESFLA